MLQFLLPAVCLLLLRCFHQQQRTVTAEGLKLQNLAKHQNHKYSQLKTTERVCICEVVNFKTISKQQIEDRGLPCSQYNIIKIINDDKHATPPTFR